MRVLISADMEGASGVVSPDDVRPGSAAWLRCRAFLTGDVNAAIDGFFRGGADQVLVNEAHSSMRNLDLAQLDARAVVIVGRDKPLGMMEGIDREIDRAALIGYHAGAGNEGVLSHTYLGTGIVGVWINGEPASEGRMSALLAAEHGASVVLVTGDDATCLDARTFAPEALTVAVKESIGRYAAACRSPLETAGAIRDAAIKTARTVCEPMPMTGPYDYEIEFMSSSAVTIATAIPIVERRSAHRVGFTLDTMTAAARCFKAVTILAAWAVEPVYG